ncbi:TetR/AcrR family transcriptional regulator [Sulfitobacter aestuariivivens]|uniref:TetR/AcrR family transcriptional regulator n=1 Tax=Sulfitobacter aestuariivivens TaxID=2766981 RepID=A0A927D726_9RHOB|nr:TetR/AcrR family transcriptional regulator [Sulfitobacter aestuariivivens]MBD3664994.1 TetR/AcrR family transcriptional regulator [Sulfitobacter aestuariivivens]
MARPREFDTDEALERAMQVFWQHGYQDASLPDLLDGMGLTRGSLYKAFKDKKSLFLLVLDRYESAQVDAGVAMLTDPANGDGRTRVLALFGGLVAAVAAGDHRGCLLCTAASSAAADDVEIASAVHGGLAKLQQGIEAAIADIEGIAPGDRLRLANTLLTQYIGLRMLARSRLPMGILEQSVEGVADILDRAAR